MKCPWLWVLLLLTGCSAQTAFHGSPPTPERPYRLPASTAVSGTLAPWTDSGTAPFIDPQRNYTLPELIDLGQRHNRTTREAWERARVAAAAAGLSAAEFYPLLAVATTYGGGAWNLDLDFNDNLSGIDRQAGVLGAILAGADPGQLQLDQQANGVYRQLTTGAALRWMLFDFGAREALRYEAKSLQTAANLVFNAAHQTVSFRVTEAYYSVESARRITHAAERSAQAATEVLASFEERHARGLLTEPQLLQARQARAQADFQLSTAQSRTQLARIDLAEAVGAPPDCVLEIAPADFAALGNELREPLNRYVDAALQRRPDLLAKVATAQAAEARVRAARADRLPKIALNGVADYQQLNTSVSGAGALDAFGFSLPNYGGFLSVQWPIFTGFANDNRVRAAEAAWKAANEEMLLARDRAIAEVWRAFIRARNALAGREAALALLRASQSTYDSLHAGFEQGISPVQDMLTARAALAQATTLTAEADQAVALSLTALAFGSGGL